MCACMCVGGVGVVACACVGRVGTNVTKYVCVCVVCVCVGGRCVWEGVWEGVCVGGRS